jgi:hypothetical protein
LKGYLIASFLFAFVLNTNADLPVPCACTEDEYVAPSCVGTVSCYDTGVQPSNGQPCCIYDPNRIPINDNAHWIILAGFVLSIAYLMGKRKRLNFE